MAWNNLYVIVSIVHWNVDYYNNHNNYYDCNGCIGTKRLEQSYNAPTIGWDTTHGGIGIHPSRFVVVIIAILLLDTILRSCSQPSGWRGSNEIILKKKVLVRYCRACKCRTYFLHTPTVCLDTRTQREQSITLLTFFVHGMNKSDHDDEWTKVRTTTTSASCRVASSKWKSECPHIRIWYRFSKSSCWGDIHYIIVIILLIYDRTYTTLVCVVNQSGAHIAPLAHARTTHDENTLRRPFLESEEKHLR